MKKILLIIFSFLSILNFAYAEKNDMYFILDGQKQVEFIGKNAKDIADKIVLVDENNNEYDVVVNIIDDSKIAISPIQKVSKKLRIKNIDNYTITNYEKNIYVQNKQNLDKISKHIKNNYLVRPIPYADTKSLKTKSSQNNKSEYVKSDDFSQTNVQTKGIDEADIAKTDGRYIYFARYNSLSIVDTNNKLVEISKIKSEEDKFLRDIYIDGKNLSLIYDSNTNKGNLYKQVTIIDTYDIANIKNPKKIKTNTVNGYYIESRKKGNLIYVLSSDYFKVNYNDYTIMPRMIPVNQIYTLDYTDIDLTKILYTPFNPSTEIINISAISTNISVKSNDISYMGSSGDIYMSNDNLYLASEVFDYDSKNNTFEESTNIKKFSLDKTNFSYKGAVDIDGLLVNQFSLNETNNVLYVAYTKNPNDSKNRINLIVSYDKDMKKISTTNSLAKGEKIYSVRYMNDNAYIVTFKEVDPLFVIDIKDPKDMKVLGYLKIPGYSDYLHPYKDGYLIGFGQKTRLKSKNIINDGFKISLFDVRDFNNPKEVNSINIGARGSYSTVQSEHKALMFDSKRDIFVFPMSVNKAEMKMYNKQEYEDVSLSFVGAYVMKASENGLKIKGKISHYSTDSQKNIGEMYDYNNTILRTIQIGNKLYTISENNIKANDINTLKDLDMLKLEKEY